MMKTAGGSHVSAAKLLVQSRNLGLKVKVASEPYALPQLNDTIVVRRHNPRYGECTRLLW